MYRPAHNSKRRFNVPLHKPTNDPDQPVPPSRESEQSHKLQAAVALLHGEPAPLSCADGTAAPAGPDKENEAPSVPVFKKTKLFAAFAPAPAQSLQPAKGACQLTPSGSKQDATNWNTPAGPNRTFSVLYCKRDKYKKKHNKGYEDGIIELKSDKSCTLFDLDGKVVTKGKAGKLPPELESGSIVELGNWVCEYDQEIPIHDYIHGRCFTAKTANLPSSLTAASSAVPASMPRRKAAVKRPTGAKQCTGLTTGPTQAAPTMLSDSLVPGAVVVNIMQLQEGKGKLPGSGRQVVPVVVDPYLSRHLRPHQCQGVTFMYECVMGLRSPNHTGCLLADEMGLGKTLQVIALLWTLLRQGPEGAPVARKAVVAAPATLVANWGKEVNKWLGQERLRTMQLTQGPEGANQVNDFKLGTVWKVLIASYETLRRHAANLAGCCDVLVCDEGHRLKATGGNKTINSLLQLGCQRRVVLTGTPVQNNLEEYAALLSFVVPGLLPASFKRIFADPITRSRDKDATEQEREIGAARAEELQRQTAPYVLRRTQEVLCKHLPPLAVHTIFCKPSDLQVEVYRAVLRSKRMTSLLYSSGGGGDSEGALPAITVLRKLCNHPKLLLTDRAGSAEPVHHEKQPQGTTKLAEVAASILQSHLDVCGWPASGGDAVELSGKLLALCAILDGAISEGSKVVVVSTSTSALDIISNLLCGPRGWQIVRIDGGTNVDARQTIVDNFNMRGIGQVFLLSTRAGGAGLNLIGANHLVLFDSDWNPAYDKQAMARIWRDGQTKPCFVHRMLTTGTIEEKVYQRQIMKSDLAGATMQSAGSSMTSLSHTELKQLFALDVGAECSTKHLLESCSKATDVTWLTLPSAAGAWKADSNMPSVLVRAVQAGAVTAINREQLNQASTGRPMQAGTVAVATAAAPDTKQLLRPVVFTKAETIDTVDALEVDDDGL